MKIIAECGVNWKDIAEAKEMIKKCRSHGIDLVKFQLFSKLYAEVNKIPVYLSVEFDQAKELFEYGKSIGQEVFFTPFDTERVGWCEKIGVKWYKVRYVDNNNLNIIIAITQTNKPYFISVHPNKPIRMGQTNDWVLNCIPEYPARLYDYLKYDVFLRGEGISDHTPDLTLIKMAKQSIFNRWIEKHVKLRQDCLETKWSVFIDDLGKVINS